MSEINPITPPYPVIKPSKINKDDQSPYKQSQGNKKSVLEEKAVQDAEPTQNIDEIV